MPAPKGNSNAVGNKGGGRKTSYKKEYSRIAYNAALLGATDENLANLFDVSEKTISTWKKSVVEFSTALKKGKDIADGMVVKSLFQRALGYSHKDVDIKVIDDQIVITKLTKHYPPDTTAAIFWLKNRQSRSWRDKTEVDNRHLIAQQPTIMDWDAETIDEIKQDDASNTTAALPFHSDTETKGST